MNNTDSQPSFSGNFEQRKYLLDTEVDSLIAAAKSLGRHGHRDALMILMAYRHGLRASELINLQWSHVMLDKAVVQVERLKNGDASVQPLNGEELRALRKLKREQGDSAFVFTSELRGPMEVSGFNKIVKRAGIKAKLGASVHPHMLRHSCGHRLAAKGVDTRAIMGYLGHRNMQHTVIYTKLAPNRFQDFTKLI